MKKFLYVTNILAPYRIQLHNHLYKIMKKYGIDYKVAFMKDIEKRRKWNLEEMKEQINFPYKIYKGFTFNLNNNHEIYFNIDIIKEVLLDKYDYVLIGGWDKLTTIFLSILPKTNNYIKIMRPESNVYSIRNNNFVYNFIKKTVVTNCDAFAIPGINTLRLLKSMDKKIKNKQIIILPNVIDNKKWFKNIENAKKNIISIKQKYGIDINKKIFFIPARLSKEKGVYNFLNITYQYIDNNTIIICAGSGNEMEKINKLIAEKRLDKKIKILGFISENKIHELYAISDVFVLPSFSDPNPLSVIEASFSELPLLLSNRIGNVPELAGKNNSLIFDPLNRKDIVDKFIISQNLSKSKLNEMGKYSFKLAYKHNDIINSLNKFVLDIINL